MAMSLQTSLFCTLALSLTASAFAAGKPATVELKSSAQTWQGKSLAHDAQTCWLLDRTGAMHEIKLKQVQEFRKVSESFRPETVVQTRDRLARETPPGMEVAAKGRYVVMGPERQAAHYAALLEDVYNEFQTHFSRRRFTLETPEFPLVVYVFPTQQQFAEYAEQEGAAFSASLKGYYSRNTNRIALYAEGAGFAALETGSATKSLAATPSSAGAVLASIEGDFRNTLIHEATHQLAYNTNLHSRLGDHPRWMSEGLAMLFEEDSRRDDSTNGNVEDRVNRSRYIWFMNYRQTRRPQQALRDFISGDDLFQQAGLDAYSEAWALSFYLIETRSAEYRRYLQTIAAREPLEAYSPDQRLADFQAAFGKDIEYFEGQYLLYHDKIRIK